MIGILPLRVFNGLAPLVTILITVVFSNTILPQITENSKEFSELSLPEAAKNGNVKAVKYFVERGDEIIVHNGTTPVKNVIDEEFIVNEPYEKAVQASQYYNLLQAKAGKVFLQDNDDEEFNWDLINSVKQSFLTKVKQFVSLGADINTKDDDGRTSLHIAAQRGYLDVAKFLLEQGADIEALDDKYGSTPMHFASLNGRLDLVKYLKEQGANIEAKETKFGRTPLHLSADQGYLDVVKYLVENGANVKVYKRGPRDYDYTPAHYASIKGHTEVVEYLVEKGKQPKQTVTPHSTEEVIPDCPDILDISSMEKMNVVAPQITEETPKEFSRMSLHDVAEQGNLEAVKYFVERGDDINAAGGIFERTPFQYALEQSHSDVMCYLAENGANINVRNEFNSTALHFAASEGDVTLIKCLTEKGADVDAKSYFGTTPLQIAARTGELAAVKILIEKGADTSVKDYRNRVPFQIARDYDHQEVVTYLLTHQQGSRRRRDAGDDTGIWVSSKPKEYSELSIHKAAEQGNLNAVKYFVERCHDVNSKNINGKTAFQLAYKNNQSEVMCYLAENGADINLKIAVDLHWTYLHLAVNKDDANLTKCLIEKGAYIDAKAQGDRTPLRQAAESGNVKIVKVLIENGADLNARDGSRRTPLHVAVLSANTNTVKVLIENGAIIDALDKSDQTPLHAAVLSGNLNKVKVLIEKGANHNARDNRNETPLKLAERMNKNEIVEYLKNL